MPLQTDTMTAARAIITSNGIPIGFMKNLRCTETKQRGSVMGLGEVTKKERPLLAITCTWSCDFYLIDLMRTGLPGLDNRLVMTLQQYKDTQTLLNVPVDITVWKKDALVIAGGVVVQTVNEVLCTIKDIYLDSTNFSIDEQQISGFQQSGEYTSPIIMGITNLPTPPRPTVG